MRRDCWLRDVMSFLLFLNNIGYIFIVRRLGKQSKLILSRSDSISNLKLNLKIHGPCGPNAHAGADLQAFLFSCFKSILLSAHKLILLIYGDNRKTEGRYCPGEDSKSWVLQGNHLGNFSMFSKIFFKNISRWIVDLWTSKYYFVHHSNSQQPKTWRQLRSPMKE